MLVKHLRRGLRRAFYAAKGYPLYGLMDQLDRTQFASRSEMMELQSEKLRRLIQHCWDSVPYYRRRMDEYGLTPADIRSTADLNKLPVLTRADVRDYQDELLSQGPAAGQPIWCRTGGSTGSPLRVANDLRGQVWANAAYYRGLSWAGYDLDRDRLALLFGGSLDPGRDMGTAKRRPGSLTLSIAAFDVNPETIVDYWHQFSEFRPQFLKGYSGATYVLAHGFKERGLEPFPLKALFTTSEFQPQSLRDVIEDYFQAPVYDYYGSVEINSLGYQCPERNGSYHIPEEHVVIEVESSSGEYSETGDGTFVITDLDNYLMPLIRYRNGDAGALSTAGCRCGRTLKKIQTLHGRTSGFLRATSGAFVSGVSVAYVMRNTESIREYSLIQEETHYCRLLYVGEGDSSGDLSLAVANLQKFLGNDMRIVPEPVDAIPLTKAGKRQFTLCKLNDDLNANHLTGFAAGLNNRVESVAVNSGH